MMCHITPHGFARNLQVREGQVRFYYGPSPNAADWRDPRLSELTSAADVSHIATRVPIWITGVSAAAPPEALRLHLAGLVLAGPGTGSLSSALVDRLAPWTAHLPVVIATRCATGGNFDDHYYRGSREKYESRGFLLAEYSHLTAVQARCLLVLRLAAGVYPQYEHLRCRTGNDAVPRPPQNILVAVAAGEVEGGSL